MSHYQADREHRLHAKILFFVSQSRRFPNCHPSPAILSPPLVEEIQTKDRQKKEGTDDPPRKRIKDDKRSDNGFSSDRLLVQTAGNPNFSLVDRGEEKETKLTIKSVQISSVKPLDGSKLSLVFPSCVFYWEYRRIDSR